MLTVGTSGWKGENVVPLDEPAGLTGTVVPRIAVWPSASVTVSKTL